MKTHAELKAQAEKMMEPVIEVAGCRFSTFGVSEKMVQTVKDVAARKDFHNFVGCGGVIRFGCNDAGKPKDHQGVFSVMCATPEHELVLVRISRRGNILRELRA